MSVCRFKGISYVHQFGYVSVCLCLCPITAQIVLFFRVIVLAVSGLNVAAIISLV